MKTLFARWQANFLTGLAIVLPAILSIGVVIWVFGTISNFTDTLLVFLPSRITHRNAGQGPMYWYWSVVALIISVVFVSMVGQLARNFLGRKLIEWMDHLLLHVPLLNKIYGALKQLNEAFTSNQKSSFKQVVLVQFPKAGQYSLGFITSEQHPEIGARVGEKMVSVFVPITPFLTSGCILVLPESEFTRLDMSVKDGLKFFISLGAIVPEHLPAIPPLTPSTNDLRS